MTKLKWTKVSSKVKVAVAPAPFDRITYVITLDESGHRHRYSCWVVQPQFSEILARECQIALCRKLAQEHADLSELFEKSGDAETLDTPGIAELRDWVLRTFPS